MSSEKQSGNDKNPITSYTEFWAWFGEHEKTFFKAVKKGSDVEKSFFEKMTPKLNELKDGYFFLTGMWDKQTAELIFTADGNVKNLVFVEELVSAAPAFPRWRITAHKPALDIENVNISMNGYEFSGDNLRFYSTEFAEYPDEIDITIVHLDFNDADEDIITNGTFIFLDNYLGELNFVTSIDTIRVIGKKNAVKELVPIERLKSFLSWRQKEFVEKYEGVRFQTADDNYSVMEGELENGNMLVAVINTDLLQWDRKASHPWILKITVVYEPEEDGMPNKNTFEILNNFEQILFAALKDFEGNLFIGRQTGDGAREIYFACRDFRTPSKVMYENRSFQFAESVMTYDLYMDKYWQSFQRFNQYTRT